MRFVSFNNRLRVILQLIRNSLLNVCRILVERIKHTLLTNLVGNLVAFAFLRSFIVFFAPSSRSLQSQFLNFKRFDLLWRHANFFAFFDHLSQSITILLKRVCGFCCFLASFLNSSGNILQRRLYLAVDFFAFNYSIAIPYQKFVSFFDSRSISLVFYGNFANHTAFSSICLDVFIALHQYVAFSLNLF